MTTDQGWRPLSAPRTPQSRITSAFARLAHAHLASTSGDAALATALAGSLFFTLPSGEARGKVLLYLVFTMAPFSIVAPLIGPLLDRIKGGRRLMVIVSGVGRAVLCFIMIRHVHSLLFFPEAFGVLVLQKTYTITKPALVPATVTSDDELVEANSKLSLLSGIGSALGAGPGALAYKIAGGAEGALVVAMLFYLATAFLGTRLPKTQIAAAGPSTEERHELHSTSILLGGSAMGMLRGIVGFMTLFIAFAFYKKSGTPWELAVVGGASVAGSQVGALIAPSLRRMTKEENLLMGALAATTVAAAIASLLDGLSGAVVLAATVGVCAAAGKLAFDSIVQRDAPDANRGRSFAKFETRFQILWVVGALIAVAPMPKEAGYLVVLLVSGLTLFSYVVGSKASAARQRATPLTGVDAAAVEIDQRMNRLADEAKQRVKAAATGWRHRDEHGRDGHGPAQLPPPSGWPVWASDDPPPPGIDDTVGLHPGHGAGATAADTERAAPPLPPPPVPPLPTRPYDQAPGGGVGSGATEPFEPSPMTFPDDHRFEEPVWGAAPAPDEVPPSPRPSSEPPTQVEPPTEVDPATEDEPAWSDDDAWPS